MVAVPRAGAIGPRAKRGARAFPSLSTGEVDRRPAAARAATAEKRCVPCSVVLSGRITDGRNSYPGRQGRDFWGEGDTPAVGKEAPDSHAQEWGIEGEFSVGEDVRQPREG